MIRIVVHYHIVAGAYNAAVAVKNMYSRSAHDIYKLKKAVIVIFRIFQITVKSMYIAFGKEKLFVIVIKGCLHKKHPQKTTHYICIL